MPQPAEPDLFGGRRGRQRLIWNCPSGKRRRRFHSMSANCRYDRGAVPPNHLNCRPLHRFWKSLLSPWLHTYNRLSIGYGGIRVRLGFAYGRLSRIDPNSDLPKDLAEEFNSIFEQLPGLSLPRGPVTANAPILLQAKGIASRIVDLAIHAERHGRKRRWG